MDVNFPPLVADLFLFCYTRDFMMSLSDGKQAYIVEAFNTTSSYLNDILNINTIYFDNMVRKIYSVELQLNKANTSDTESKKDGKDQDLIQSSTTPDPGYQWESDA